MPLCEFRYLGCVGGKALITSPVVVIWKRRGVTDIGNILDWGCLRLCCLPGCRSLHERTGMCRGKPKCPVCVGTWGCCSLHLTLQQQLRYECVQGFRTQFSALQSASVVRLLALLFLCFRNIFQVCHGTYYGSFTRMGHQEMHKIWADLGRNAPVLQCLRLGTFSGWWSQITGV